MSGRRIPNSHTGRVRAFFLANPDEELTNGDVRIKFDLDEFEAAKVLYRLRQQGFLATDRSVRPAVHRRQLP